MSYEVEVERLNGPLPQMQLVHNNHFFVLPHFVFIMLQYNSRFKLLNISIGYSTIA